jgi:hypothetical protein
MDQFKYKINDEIWVLFGNKAVKAEITGRKWVESNNLCNWGNIKIYCVNLLGAGGYQMSEKDEETVFKTKEELLASL